MPPVARPACASISAIKLTTRSPQHASQHFHRMQRLAPCSVVDLVAAAGAGCADHGAGARTDGGKHCLLGDLHGEVVALFGKSKAAGQAAAQAANDNRRGRRVGQLSRSLVPPRGITRRWIVEVA